MIRRFAFQFSESVYPHWLPLLLADKVNVVEGIIDDLAHGHVPNIYAEKGYGASWKHDRPGQLVKLAVGAAIAVGVFALLTSASSSDKREKKRDRKRDKKRDRQLSYEQQQYELEF